MKLKSFAYGFATALVLVLVLSLAVASFAATPGIQKQIMAVFGGKTLVFDGVRMTPKDVNNNEVQPILYQGTTYVPIRFISEAFNKKVTYVPGTTTIYLGDAQATEAFLLRDMRPYEKTQYTVPNYGSYGGWASAEYPNDKRFTVISWSNTGKLMVADKEYVSQSMILSAGIKEDVSSYMLNGKYRKLTADFGIDDISTDTTGTYGIVEIYGDGKQLYRINKAKGYALEHFEVDLTGVSSMTIKVKGSATSNTVGNDTAYSSQVVCDFINVRMYPVDPANTQP